MKKTGFDINIDKKKVLSLVDCKPDNPMYGGILAELEELLPSVYDKIKAEILYDTGSLGGIAEKYGGDDHEALFVVTTAGVNISKWAAELFSEGRYMAGMLADAAADVYLFQMEAEVALVARDYCQSRNKGVCARLEAPRDIPMSAQKKALEVTDAEALAGIRVTESYMFDPVKTMCQIYVLDEDTDKFNIYRSCSSCPNVTCNLRNSYGGEG